MSRLKLRRLHRLERRGLAGPGVMIAGLAVSVLLALSSWHQPAVAAETANGSALDSAASQPEEPAAAIGATAADCAECHEIVDAFARGPHGRAMRRSAPDLFEGSCVGCHGPGEEHIDDPVPENIVGVPGDSACTSCHQGSSGTLSQATPAHQRHSIRCLDCHRSGHDGGHDVGQDVGHDAVEEAPLLAAKSTQVCGSCHSTQASAARMPFAHREGSEPFACTECHSAHGQERTGRLLASVESGACLDCHTELAGPFVFPHPPRAIHGCSDCHQPHGSTNPRMLTRRNVLNNCLECHTGVPAFHDLSQARFRNCTSCHMAVHGSNRDPVLFDP